MPIASPWTPEEDAVLTELWCSGMTAREIVDNFPERTKNAIIGRVHRLRLERNLPDREGAISVHHHPKRQHPFRPKAPLVMPEADLPPAREGGITIMELRSGLCRDVLDLRGAPDGLALYCGKRTIGGKSFCPHHEGLYYTPYTARRRS